MIEIQSDELIFSFPELLAPLKARVRAWVDERLESATNDEKNMLPSGREEVHRMFGACLTKISATVSFQRTLRLPDNGKDYPMPLGLGRFPLYPVDEFPTLPEAWQQRGGIMMPLHPTEALWLSFYADYPMALRVGSGGFCAVSGLPWASALVANPQNYVVLGTQPWLDGFHVGADVVRQFVAHPVGQGLQAPHALSGEERWSGLRLQAVPLRPEEFWRQSLKPTLHARWDELMTPIRHRAGGPGTTNSANPDWTFKAGGKIRLKIVPDPFSIPAWETSLSSRCFAHLCLAEDWQRLTGIRPPQKPPTAADYRAAGVTWSDLEGGKPTEEKDSLLAELISASINGSRTPFPGTNSNPPLPPRSVVRLNPNLRQAVREF